MQIRRHVPSVATLGNAAAGLIACAFALKGPEYVGFAALMILAAVLMDSMDGALARTLDATSDFGAELDSLSDVISFGVAPAIVAGALLPEGVSMFGWALLLAYPLCTAWRLAKFNAMRAEHGSFSGLPSTGAGAASASLILLQLQLTDSGLTFGPLALPLTMLMLGMLMVSPVSYRHVGMAIGRLHPIYAVLTAGAFVASAVFWHYEYLLAAMTLGYTASGPLAVARAKLRAVRHA